jgi:hypothetical protein
MAGTHRMTIIHRVPDLEKWMAVMKAEPGKDRPGLVRRAVYQSLDDPNELLVEVEFESAEAAKAFLPSLPMRDLLDSSGLEMYPPVFIGEELDELRVEYR